MSDDPCTISWDVIARFLESRNRPRCAAFVRRHGEQVARILQEREEWQKKCGELRARLNAYEPPEPTVVARSYRSPATSDG
jgi:hypothetical protein